MKAISKWVLVLAMVGGGSAFAQGALTCGAGSRVSTMNDKDIVVESCVRVSDGMCNGTFRARYKAGGIHTQGQCQDGMRSGHWTYFDVQGKKTAEIDFQAGDYHGVRVEYHPNGLKKFEENFERGKLLTQKNFDEKGVLTSQLPVPAVVPAAAKK